MEKKRPPRLPRFGAKTEGEAGAPGGERIWELTPDLEKEADGKEAAASTSKFSEEFGVGDGAE